MGSLGRPGRASSVDPGRDVTRAPWACLPDNGELSLPNVNYFLCVDTFAGQLTTYHVMAFGFGLIALAGLAWPLLSRVWRQGRR